MSKVFVSIALSLHGYMAPSGMTMEHWDNPDHENWGARWGELMGWIFELQHFASCSCVRGPPRGLAGATRGAGERARDARLSRCTRAASSDGSWSAG